MANNDDIFACYDYEDERREGKQGSKTRQYSGADGFKHPGQQSNGSYYNHNSQISVASLKYPSGISGNEPIKMNRSKNRQASYKSGIKEWAPLPLDKIN